MNRRREKQMEMVNAFDFSKEAVKGPKRVGPRGGCEFKGILDI